MQTKHCKRLVKTAAIPSSKMTVMDVIRQKVCRHLVVIYNTSPVGQDMCVKKAQDYLKYRFVPHR